MSFPEALIPTRSELVDVVAISATATADSLGTATVTIPADPNRHRWVQRIAVTTTSATPTTCRVYAGTVTDANLVDATVSGNQDIADEVQPIYLPAGTDLVVRWTTAVPGATCSVNVQLQRTPIT